MAVAQVNSMVAGLAKAGQVIGTAGVVVSTAHLASKFFEKLEARESLVLKGEWKDGVVGRDKEGKDIAGKVFERAEPAEQTFAGKGLEKTGYIRPAVRANAWASAGLLAVSLAALQGVRYATGQRTVIDWGRSVVTQLSSKVGR